MKKLITLVLAFVMHYAAQGQTLKGQVKGQDGAFLVNSTVMLLDTKDSTMLSFTKTKENGLFEVKSSGKGDVLLQVSNVGYEKFLRYISLTGADQNLGVITLDSATRELAELVVKGERAAVGVNKDTVEFNAGSFKVQENAMVEELLKRMPGMEVDREGNVTAQGKNVTRILVDGKEFFGRDPKMSTKNIPANAIDKVQVFDKKSDRAEFTGIDDGEEETTINLKLRADKKNLGFGRFVAGAGVDGNSKSRYNLGANYYTFKNGNQLSFIGNANNINEQSFSTSDFSMAGIGRGGGGISFGGGGMGLGRTGLMRNISGGLNFNNKLSPKTEINGSYSYTNTNLFTTRESTTESVIGTLETNGNAGSQQNTESDSHRLNVTLNNKINDKNSIRWINRVDYRNNTGNTLSESEEYLKSTGELRNSTDRMNTSKGNSFGLTSQALYRKAFARRGRSFTTNLTLGINNGDTDGTLVSHNGLFDSKTGSIAYTDLNQVNNQISRKFTMGAEVSYTEPLNSTNFLEFNYSYQKVNNDLDKSVYNVKETGNTLDTTLSNRYNNDYVYNRAGLSYRISKDKWNGNIGAAIQDSKLEGDLILRNETIRKRFTNPVFTGRVRYSISSARSMDLSYNTNISEPSMTQLSPVPDNSNPLNIFVGNPNLKPQYSQRLNLNFRDFNQLKFTNFFVTAGLSFTDDKITNKVIYDEVTLAQTRTPINYGNDVSVNGNINYGFRVRAINTRFSLNSNVNYGRSMTLINNIDNITKTLRNGNSIRADFMPGDNFNMGVSTRLTFNNSKYSQNTQLNPSYMNQDYTGDLQWILPNVFTLTSSLDYSIYRYATSNEVQRIPIWNAALLRPVLKNKRGEIKFSVNDLLNKNQGITQTASGNTFTEERTNALGRYFLFTFTYNLNGGIQGNIRQGGGGPRIIGR
ncbi:outer membrane beta-barrel protein [Leadbetterella sp. DM7]|uniref:outer membrane beta-barrel protein n=1 Tax=Leadbetterella sp. DM7 TaxID=3235085 RepID=UPI00349EC8F4